LIPAKSGSKRELLNYLTSEVGGNVDFVWKNKLFFLEGTLKTPEMGKAFKTLASVYFMKTGDS